jgi:NAD(P)-dependent dehydrogenase (short-subunit alcohol dehydrogenase family)
MGFGIDGPDFPESGCAVIFGATGGIGAATAGLLAERGCDVVITYRSRKAEAEALAARIRELGRKATALACDVTDQDQVNAVVETGLAEHGRVHTVVSSAGLVFRTRSLVDFTHEEFQGVIQADVMGFLNIAKATVPALRSGGGGTITALITSAVDRTVPTDALSATPKAAVSMMVRMLATEEAPNNIRANAIGPGVIEGGMVPPMRADEQTKNLLDGAVGVTPMGRLGLCEEVAEAIAFVASAKASYITGQRLMVDGGLST